jgi:hypothetical protein
MAWLEAVERNSTRLTLPLQSLAEERFGGGFVASSTQLRFNRFAVLIHSTVKKHPFTAYPHICLVCPP